MDLAVPPLGCNTSNTTIPITQAHGSLTRFLISTQLIGIAVQWPKNMPTCDEISHNLPHHLIPRTTNLHHPPIRHARRIQPVSEDGDLKNRHPSKQPDFEKRQGEEIGFCGADEGLRAPDAGHGSDGEVLEEDAEEEGEGEVWHMC